MAPLASGSETAPAIAIFPWGEVIEEFLDPIGLSVGDFVDKMTGGWLFGYVQALHSRGWRAVIVCASEGVDRPTCLSHAGTGAPVWLVPARRASPDPNPRFPSLRYVQQWMGSPERAFIEVLARERCTALLVQEYEYFRFDLLARLARRTERPLYATFQGGDLTLSALERAARPWFLRQCNGLIVASGRERSRLAKTYPRLQVPVADIPNPLDTDEWRPVERTTARAKLGLPADAFLVLNHGRIDIGRKGLDVLVEAWRRFAPRQPIAQAFIIGSGQDHAAFAQLLQERAPERLTWTAHYITDRAQMRLWLSAADAYVIASRTEGMPVAPLEAMACGLPVVTSDANGLPDIFTGGEEHGGIITAREDVDAIVTALERLAADAGLRARLGAAARRRVEQHFSIPAVGTALDQLIRRGGARQGSGILSPAT